VSPCLLQTIRWLLLLVNVEAPFLFEQPIEPLVQVLAEAVVRIGQLRSDERLVRLDETAQGPSLITWEIVIGLHLFTIALDIAF